MTETDLIRERFTKPVKKHWSPAYVQKIVGTAYNAGQPDLFLVIAGKACVIEAKKEGGKVTELQWESLWQAHRSGAEAAVLWFKKDGRLELACLNKFTNELLSQIAIVIKAEVTYVEKQ